MAQTPIDAVLDKVEWVSMEQPIDDGSGLPYATHAGVLKIGDIELKCYQLSDGNRVFEAESVERFFGGMNFNEVTS